MTRKFYFKDELIKRNKMYGYHIREVSIYYLDKEGDPHLIDRITYQTGSTPGNKQEAFDFLADNGYVPKKYKVKTIMIVGHIKSISYLKCFNNHNVTLGREISPSPPIICVGDRGKSYRKSWKFQQDT